MSQEGLGAIWGVGGQESSQFWATGRVGQSPVSALCIPETNTGGSRVGPLRRRWPHSPGSELKPLCPVSPHDGPLPSRASSSPAIPCPPPHPPLTPPWSGDSFEEAKNCFIFRH